MKTVKNLHRLREAAQKPGTMFLILTTVLFAAGVYFLGVPHQAQAAVLTKVKDVLSTSAPTSDANHVIQFVTATGAAQSSDTITIEFDTTGTGFDLTSIAEDDIDLEVDNDAACDGSWTDRATAGSAASDVWGVNINTTTDVITLTHPTNDGSTEGITAGRCARVIVGNTANGSGTGSNQINNPTKVAGAGTADIYTIAIAGTFGDSGDALVAVVEGVSVSVTIDETLTFAIAAVTSGNCTQGGSATAVTTTVSTVPFGTSGLSPNTFYKGCHDLTVSTNASNGYAITTEENRSLLSGTDTLDDTQCDGTDCTEVIGASTTTAWATSTNNGFGYTCSGGDCNAAFNTASEFNQFACTGADAVCDPNTGAETAATPISAATPVSNQTSRIVYKLSFSGTQPAGTYTNTITYIATPTF